MRFKFITLQQAILLTFFSAVEPIWAYDDICVIKPVQDKRVVGRANQIRFPNGRLLTIVGHNHGERAAVEISLESQKLAKMTSAELEDFIQSALNKSYANPKRNVEINSIIPSAIRNTAARFKLNESDMLDIPIVKIDLGKESSTYMDAVYDKSFLLSSLRKKTDRPQFIGLESRTIGIKRIKELFLFIKKEISRHIPFTKLSESEINNFLLTGFTGHVHAYLEYPEIQRIAPLVAIEGDAYYKSRDTKSEVKDAGLNYIDEMFNDNEKHLSQQSGPELKLAKNQLKLFIFSFIDLIFKMESRFKDVENIDQLISQFHERLPPWLKASGMKYIEILKSEADQVDKRDKQSAENLASRNQTGIYFVGRLHLEPQSKHLVSLCKKELQSIEVLDLQVQ